MMNEPIQHEPDVVNTKLLVISGIGLVLVIALALLVMRGAIAVLAGDAIPAEEPVTTAPRDTDAVKFIPDQAQQLQQLRAAEDRRLNHYDWIDEHAGVAQIPIERAMAILAEQVLPETEVEKENDDDPTEN